MDPRVKTAPAALLQQFTLSKRLSDAIAGLAQAVAAADPEVTALSRNLLNAYNLIQGADVAPTTQAVKAANEALAAYAARGGKAPTPR